MKRATALVLVCLSVLVTGCVPKSDLEAAKKQISDLEAQVASGKSDNAQLQSENAQLKETVASLQGEGAQLKESISSLKGEGAQLKSQLARKPTLPVTMGLRRAVTGPGYVAMFDTTVKSPVTVLATLHSAALGTNKQFELHLNPTLRTELGHMEGAVIERGDTITLENTNYEPARFTIRAP